jgi:hypothetical protein
MGEMLGGAGGLPPIPGNLPPGFEKFLKKK